MLTPTLLSVLPSQPAAMALSPIIIFMPALYMMFSVVALTQFKVCVSSLLLGKVADCTFDLSSDDAHVPQQNMRRVFHSLRTSPDHSQRHQPLITPHLQVVYGLFARLALTRSSNPLWQQVQPQMRQLLTFCEVRLHVEFAILWVVQEQLQDWLVGSTAGCTCSSVGTAAFVLTTQ